MSLEARIAELNDNIKALISVMQQGGAGAVIKEPAAPVTETKSAKKSAPPAAEPAAAPSTPEPAAPAVEVEESCSDITITEVTAVVLALGKAGKRDALVKLLGEYGVPKASALDPSKFAEFHTKATKLMEV